MENAVKKGYLFCHVRGVAEKRHWQRRYYVLYGVTSRSRPRLDFYENEEAYKKDPSVRKTIYLEEIDSLKLGAHEGKEYGLELSGKKNHILAAETERIIISWYNTIKECQDGKLEGSEVNRVSNTSSVLSDEDDTMFDENTIYESADECDRFRVSVAESDASKRCHLVGDYTLVVSSRMMTLTKDGSHLYTWPYKYIRRYGRSKTSFTFEAGRKCQSGDGLFTFKTEDGESLFRSVQGRTSQLKENESGGGSAGSSLERNIKAPTVPSRNYTGEDAGAEKGAKEILGTKPARPPPLTSPPPPPTNKQAQPTSIPAPRAPAKPAPAPRSQPPLLKPFPPGGRAKQDKETQNAKASKGQQEALKKKAPFLDLKKKISLEEVPGSKAKEYELGKISVPGGGGEIYSEPYEAKVLEVRRGGGGMSPDINANTDPEYAEYDLSASDRLKSLPQATRGKQNHGEETMSDIIYAMSKEGGASEDLYETDGLTRYDRLCIPDSLARPPVERSNSRPLPDLPGGEYEDANTFGKTNTTDADHLYDEVLGRK